MQIEYDKLTKENSIYLNSLKQELKEVNTQIDNLILLASKKPLKSILAKIELLENKKEDIELRLNINVTANGIITANKIKEVLNKDIKELKNNSSKIEIKNLIKKYIKKIDVGSNVITIEYNFSNINSVLNMYGRGDPLTYIFKTTLLTEKYCAKRY